MLDFITASVQLDPLAIVRTGGYLGIAFIVFAESGLLIGIFFPGDSLLFVAGLLAAGGFFSIGPLIAIVVVAAILGDSVGYWFGARVGINFFKRKDSRFFKQEYVERTKKFYDEYGARAIVLARFVPIVRTLAPILAGIGSMSYSKFLRFNIIGGVLWGTSIPLLGYFLGTLIPNSERYILPITLVIIVLSFLPIFLNIFRATRSKVAPP